MLDPEGVPSPVWCVGFVGRGGVESSGVVFLGENVRSDVSNV